MISKKILKQFPLKKNKNLIYFDNSAATLIPLPVINEINNYNTNLISNVGRSLYPLATTVTQKVDLARKTIANFIGANSTEIVFTKNTTEAINLVAKGFVKNIIKKGDEIVVSKLEHHSNYLPWLEVAKQCGAKLVTIEPDKNNNITLNAFKKVVTSKTKFVAITHVSNVLGNVVSVKEIAKLAHKIGALVLVDSAQSVSHFPIDVKNLNVDFLTFSGYKLFSQNGVGVLFANSELINEIEPQNLGGGMVLDITEKLVQHKTAPESLEGGTLPVASILGLGKSIEFINSIGMENISSQNTILKNYLVEELQKIDDIKIYSTNATVPIVSYNIKGIHPHDAATLYGEMGVCLRAGQMCAIPLINHLNEHSVLRVSLAFYNTTKEIDKFISVTKNIIKFFKSFE